MTISFWQKNFNKKYDFIIVGAGISGLSLTYWLNQKYPNKTILLVDKNNIFSGASGRNAGFLSLGGFLFLNKDIKENNGKNILKIKENINLLEQLKIIEENQYFQKKGTNLLLEKNKESEFNTLSNFFKENKIKHKINKIKFKEDFINLNYSEAYSINPIQIRENILSKLNNKVSFQLGTTLKNHNNNIIETSMGSFYFEKLFITTGFELNKEFKEILNPCRAQCLSLKFNKLTNIPLGNFSSRPDSLYFRRYENNIIIGGSRYLDRETEETVIDNINDKIQNNLINFIKKKITDEKFKVDSQWSGILTYKEDKLPLIENKNNVYYFGGMSGHGMAFAFIYARDLVQYL